MAIKKDNKDDINELLAEISRGRLNKLVQAELFSHEYKGFSSFLKNFVKNEPPYGLVMARIQKGLYGGRSGSLLKKYKNVENYASDSKSITKYMSPTELIRYRAALAVTQERFSKLSSKGVTMFETYFNEAEDVGKDVFTAFNRKYRSEGFVDKSGISLDDCVIKSFNKALKLGFSKLMLTSLNLKPGEKLTLDSKPDFDPYSELSFKRYENYRKRFVRLIEEFESNYLTDRQIRNLFTAYEERFYNTTYLRDNNICALDYSLGLGEDTFFSKSDFDYFDRQLAFFEYSIKDMYRHSLLRIPADTIYKEMYEKVCNEGKNNRQLYISRQVDANSVQRPETSSVFLTACLENIMFERGKLSRPYTANMPSSFAKKAALVKNDISTKRKKQINDNKHISPSLMDLGLVK